MNRVRGRTIGLVLLAGIGVTALVVLTRTGGFASGVPVDVLALPDVGEIRAEMLSDGTPVYVVHDLDGTVIIVEALSPLDRDAPMGWCAASRTVEDLRHGGKWDAQGRYVSGPAPSDLARYENRLDDGFLAVLGRIPALDRSEMGGGHPSLGQCVRGRGVSYELHPGHA